MIKTPPVQRCICMVLKPGEMQKKLSDWDLLILLNTPNVLFDVETKFMDAFCELELKTGEIFSPLIYSKNDWNSNYSITPLYENIQKEGIRLNDRNSLAKESTCFIIISLITSNIILFEAALKIELCK